jgi:hypothetical protein
VDVKLQKKVFDRTDKVVCKRCHMVMNDFEPCSPKGEFSHPSGERGGRPIKCKNAGKTFVGGDAEIVPFVRKALRRTIKRASKFR